jgi:hypothetical protein
MMAEEPIIQHTPTDKPGETFHAPGSIMELPHGKKYRLTEKGWELIDEKNIPPAA